MNIFLKSYVRRNQHNISPQLTPSATAKITESFLDMTPKQSAMGSPFLTLVTKFVSYNESDIPKT